MSTKKETHFFEERIELLNQLDIGITVIDAQFQILYWNHFMSNHSGYAAKDTYQCSLFSLYKELDTSWFRRKVSSVLSLHNSAFITWEERSCLIPFKSYRPFTGTSSWMYQNVTLMPLTDKHNQVNHLAIVIYDVTDEAVSKLALKKANHELNLLSQTDGLTQLNNRAYWEKCLANEFERFVRTQHSSSLIMLDIDHFKRVNDSYGHTAGDRVLVQVARLIRRIIRTTDIAGRYGGEEFGILLPNTNAADAEILAERLRYEIEMTAISYEEQNLFVSISLGIAAANNDYPSYLDWLKNADQALYEAKQKGRNQFVSR